VGMFGMLVSKVPLPVQAKLVPVLTQLPLSLANMICTNVPGPQVPLYLLGHKLLRCYPYVPIGGELGVNVAILSYNGIGYVGFGGDVSAVPDIERFEDMLRESFAELREAAAKQPAPAESEEEPARRKGRPRTIPESAARPKAPKPRMRTIPVAPAPTKRKQVTRKAVAIARGAKPVSTAVEAPLQPLAKTGD